MVRINRVHGFRERLHQLKELRTNDCHRDDCIMCGGLCDCAFIDLCKYAQELKGANDGD